MREREVRVETQKILKNETLLTFTLTGIFIVTTSETSHRPRRRENRWSFLSNARWGRGAHWHDIPNCLTNRRMGSRWEINFVTKKNKNCIKKSHPFNFLYFWLDHCFYVWRRRDFSVCSSQRKILAPTELPLHSHLFETRASPFSHEKKERISQHGGTDRACVVIHRYPKSCNRTYECTLKSIRRSRHRCKYSEPTKNKVATITDYPSFWKSHRGWADVRPDPTWALTMWCKRQWFHLVSPTNIIFAWSKNWKVKSNIIESKMRLIIIRACEDLFLRASASPISMSWTHSGLFALE